MISGQLEITFYRVFDEELYSNYYIWLIKLIRVSSRIYVRVITFE